MDLDNLAELGEFIGGVFGIVTSGGVGALVTWP